jgi:hypothetical protein
MSDTLYFEIARKAAARGDSQTTAIDLHSLVTQQEQSTMSHTARGQPVIHLDKMNGKRHLTLWEEDKEEEDKEEEDEDLSWHCELDTLATAPL